MIPEPYVHFCVSCLSHRKMLFLPPCMFKCRSDSLCLSVMEPGNQNKNFFERIISKRKEQATAWVFFLSGSVHQAHSHAEESVTLVGCLVLILFSYSVLSYLAQMIISWIYLCPHISNTSPSHLAPCLH